jgi:hypothetical protein
MLRDMSPSEFGLWFAAYRVSPWGEWRGDFQSGIVASVIANVNRDPKKRAEPFSTSDFMYDSIMEAHEKEKTGQQLSQKMRNFFKLHNARTKGA